jgi:hypothetical protein
MDLSDRSTIGATFGIIFGIAIGTAFGAAFGAGIGAAFGATIGVAIGAAIGAAIGLAIKVPSAQQSVEPLVQPSAPPLVHIYLSKTDLDEMIAYLKKEKELDEMGMIITNQCRKRTMTRSNLDKLQQTYNDQFDQQTALLKQWIDRGLLDEFRKLTGLIKT